MYGMTYAVPRGDADMMKWSPWRRAVIWMGSVRTLFSGYRSLWEEDRDVQDAKTWASAYEPQGGKHYEDAKNYALWRYELAQSHWDDLDKKADDIAKYAALVVTAIGAVGTAAVSQLCHIQTQSILWLLPSVGMSVIAFALAIIARSPTLLPIPGNARLLLGFADDQRITDADQMMALIAASLHTATVGLRVVVKEKARRVTLAAWALLFSLALLMIPLVRA